MSWQTTIKDKVCLNSGKRCLSAEECNALWMQRKRIFLLFFCSLSLHPIGSILYFYELLVLCALQKNVLQCPREALRRSTPPFRSLLVCSSFFVPAVGVRWSFQLSNWITSSNSSQHSEHDRSDSREDFWEGRRALIVFFPLQVLPQSQMSLHETQAHKQHEQRPTRPHKPSICLPLKAQVSNSVAVIKKQTCIHPRSPRSPNWTPRKMRNHDNNQIVMWNH